eukprot:TRINITY_DN26064_c0_g1_i2.p1 TRINITY_DN26064_c0_g1~~TRINITY_DN26064_c0_g1_i2.p1  ORF type:complete len:294 (-),score=43.32 TRINITY_DN26064_c0_g1_i2:1216-2058(-)
MLHGRVFCAFLFVLRFTWRTVAGDVNAPLLFSGATQDSLALDDLKDTCNVDTVQVANIRQLHPILEDLVNTTFFRLFRVNLKNPVCPYWPQPDAEKDHAKEASSGGTCTGSVPTIGGGVFGKAPSFGKSSPLGFSQSKAPGSFSSASHEDVPCGVDSDGSNDDEIAKTSLFSSQPESQDSDELDRSMSKSDQYASDSRSEDAESCEFEEDLPTYWSDMCSGDSTKGIALEDVNLIKNPERNTGYDGSHIWQAMYNENCFEVGSGLPRRSVVDKGFFCTHL